MCPILSPNSRNNFSNKLVHQCIAQHIYFPKLNKSQNHKKRLQNRDDAPLGNKARAAGDENVLVFKIRRHSKNKIKNQPKIQRTTTTRGQS
jgi:hypothetical protein